ncbi:MAG: hypothetical protein NTW38_10760 [Candidatus Aminicenantes bacterium]|nr:hypothetical protein [Candidatus Aminicenantes bacterium]
MSVTKQGHLIFNAACTDKFVKDYAWAELHYDRKERLIGLKLSKDERPDAYKINRNRKGRYVYVSAFGFLRYFEIPHPKTKACAVTWDEKDKMLVLDLKA